MKNVLLVSYPRSGQHYTEQLLSEITGKDDYCVPEQCGRRAGQHRCPGAELSVLQRMPCRKGLRFQKSHDLNGRLPVTDDFLYMTLYRRPMHSFCSHAFLKGVVEKGFPVVRTPGQPLEFLERTQENWEVFALQSAENWKRFVDKWAAAGDRENVLNLRYEDIVLGEEGVTQMFEFFFGTDYDRAALAAKMDAQAQAYASGTRKARDPQAFQFGISTELLDRIRDIIGADSLARAGYDDIV